MTHDPLKTDPVERVRKELARFPDMDLAAYAARMQDHYMRKFCKAFVHAVAYAEPPIRLRDGYVPQDTVHYPHGYLPFTVDLPSVLTDLALLDVSYD